MKTFIGSSGGVIISFDSMVNNTFKFRVCKVSDGSTVYSRDYETFPASARSLSNFNLPANINESYVLYLYTQQTDYNNCVQYGVYNQSGVTQTDYSTCVAYAVTDVADTPYYFDTTKSTYGYSWATPTSSSIVTLSTVSGSGSRYKTLSANVDVYINNAASIASRTGSNVSIPVTQEGTYFQVIAYAYDGSVTNAYASDVFSLVNCVIQNTVFTPVKPTTPTSTDGSVFVNFTGSSVNYTIELYKSSSKVNAFNNVKAAANGFTFNNLSSGTYTVVIYAAASTTACRYTSSSLNLQANVRYYITNSGTYTYYTSCPLPQITVTPQANKIVSVSWLPEGTENGNATSYDYTVIGNSNATGTNTTVVDTNTTSTSFTFTAALGVTYTIKVRANCKSSDNTINTSSYTTTTYAISYYYKQNAQGTIYLESCPMLSGSIGVDSSNTLSVYWYSAGEVGKELTYPGRYTVTIYDAATGGNNLFTQQYTAAFSSSTLANVSEDKTYRAEIVTTCNANASSDVFSQTITPLYFTATGTNGTVANPQPSVLLTSRINGVNVIQQQTGVSDIASTMSSVTKTLSLAAGSYTFKGLDPNNTANYKSRNVTLIDCQLTALNVSVTMPNTTGIYASVTVSINSSAQFTYTLSASGFTTYTVTNFDKGFTKGSLPPSTYTVRATQANNPSCWIEKTFSTYSCDASISGVTVVNPSTYGGTGTAKINSNSPDSPDYTKEYYVQLNGTYTLNRAYVTNPLFNVTAGTWTAYIRYALNSTTNTSVTNTNPKFCTATYQFIVGQPSQCNLPSSTNLTLTNASTFGGNGNVKSNLSSYNGTTKLYRIRAVVAATTVGNTNNANNANNASFGSSKTMTDGASDGSTTVYTGNTSDDVVYDWTTTSEFNLPAGDYVYDVNVSDISNCTTSTSFTINNPTCNLSSSNFTVSTTPRSYSSADGTITISPKMAVIGTLYYSLVRTDTNAVVATYTGTSSAQGKTFTALTNATYTINVSYQGYSCSAAISVVVAVSAFSCNLTSVIIQPEVINVTTYGGNDGGAIVNLSEFDTNGLTFEAFLKKNGTIVKGPTTNSTFSGLSAGAYEYIIDYKEQPTCSKIVTFSISQPLRCNLSDSNNITVNSTQATYGTANGTATITIATPITSGASAQYRISSTLNNISTTAWQNSNVFTNLAVGTYYYEVRYSDYTYCSYSGSDKVFTISHVCPTVNIQISAIDNGNDIIFTWTNITPTPQAYDVIVQKAGTTINTASLNTNNYTISNAAKNTLYKIQVSPRYTNCTPISKDSDPYQIVANTDCPMPGAMTAVVDPADNTHTLVSWGASSTGTYLFSFKKVSDSGYSTEIETTNPNYSIALEKGIPYNFQVRTKCAAAVVNTTNNSGYVYLNYTRYLCAQPTNIVIAEQTGGSVKVSCTVPGNKLYYSYRKTNESYTGNDTYVDGSSFSFIPETNASYEIRVRSVCNSQEDPTSGYVLTAYTRSCPVVQQSSITYSPSADNQSLVLSWISSESTFKCRYKVKADADSTYSSWQNINQKSFTFSPIPNKVYNVQIVTLCGNSPSTECTVEVILYRCDLITNLSAGYSQTDNQIIVTWSGKSSSYGYHYIYWKTSNAVIKNEADTVNGASSFLFNAIPNKKYKIGVKSLCNGNGINTNESAYTYIDYIYNTCPLIPTLTIVDGADGETTVSWAASNSVTKYVYNYSIDDGTDANSSETTDSYFVFEPILNKNYIIEVSAVCDEVTTTPKSANYQKSYCPVPTGTINTVENGLITNVQWTAVSNAESYQFRYKKKTDTAYTTKNCLVNSTTFNPAQGVEYVLGVRVVCSAAGSIYSNWITLDSYVKSLPGISRWKGVVYSQTQGDNTTQPNLSNNSVQGVFVTADDAWVGTAPDSRTPNYGVWHMNNTTKATEQFGTASGVVSGRNLPSNDVRSVWQSADSLWAATTAGLWRKDITPQHTLGSNPVQSLRYNYGGKDILFVLNKDSGHLFKIDANTDVVSGYIVVPKGSYRMRLLKDVNDANIDKIYIQNEKNETITIINAATGDTMSSVKNEGGIIMKNGNAYVLNFIDATLTVINATSNTQLNIYSVPYRPVSHDVVDTGNIAVVSRVSHKCTLINNQNGIATDINFGTGVNSPEQVVGVGNNFFVKLASYNTISKIDASNASTSTISLSGIVNYISKYADKLLVLTTTNVYLLDSNGNVLNSNSCVNASMFNIGDNGIAYITRTDNIVSSFNLSTYAYVDNAYTVGETAYNAIYARNKIYIVTQKNDVHRLTVLNGATGSVIRVLALLGKVVDMNYVGNKFIYLNIENTKNISIIDAEINSSSDINLDSIAINYPVRNTVYFNSKYYVLHRSGEKVVIVNTDNNYLDGFVYLENNANYINSLSTNPFRYIGGVDNMATLWMNGLMKGSVWHGGTWARGMFTHKDLPANSTDFFGSEVTDTNGSYQSGIWLRGIWLSGYFSQYDDRADLTNPNYYSIYGKRSIFMGLKAGNAYTNDNIFGLSSVDLDNYKTDILENPATNDHSYSSLFARRLTKYSAPTVKRPYVSVFNGKFVNGIIFDDDKIDTTNRPLASIYSSFAGNYFNKEHYLTSDQSTQGEIIGNISDATSTVANALETTVKQAKNTVFTAPDNWQPLFYYYGQAKITDTRFLQEFYNFGKALTGNNGVWRHNHTVYGDGTVFTDDGSNYATLPYNVSIAQGAANPWNTNDAPGEPRYGGNSGLSQ